MNKVAGFFLMDWRRKLLALGIAFLIWSWVQGQIATDRNVDLTLVVSENAVRSLNHLELSIEVPEGWVLTDPPAGRTVPITLHGSNSELTDFITRQCAALLEVKFDADPLQDSVDFPVTPDDLEWLRPLDASFLLGGVKGGQQLQKLTFQRIAKEVLAPSFREVTIIGKPSEAHEARMESMVFLPSQITLTGPKRAMDQLMARINDAHSANGELETSGLFSTMILAGNERKNVTTSLHLAALWAKRGIKMDPPRVMAELPVGLRDPKSQTWLPDANDLILLPADDVASNGPWTMEPWVPTTWIAELPEVESDLELNAQWVEEHVKLLLPMHTLNANSLDRTALPIEAHLFNFDDPAERDFYRKHLVIRPLDPDSATVTVTRNP
ncbi:MAG: hypothetical protein QM477_09160 [Planctomycetota bacterium]